MIFKDMKAWMASVAIAASGVCLTAFPVAAAVAGVLNCDVAGGQGLLIGAERGVVCTYHLTGGGTETYAGTLIDAGLVLGELKAGKMIYDVYGLLPPKVTDLNGSFIGGGIGGSVGFDKGLRADSLVGGPANAIVLQPASETATQAAGINVSAGVRTLSLTHSAP